jgi:HEAT repeat protein
VSFLTSQNADIRISTTTALGEIGDITVLPQLRPLLADIDTGVQKAAKRAIEKLESKVSAQKIS